MTPGESPRIDSLLVADHAEAVNGKLYVMGGGFDTLWAPQFPLGVRFSFAALLKVPWNDTNRRLPIQGWVTRADDDEELGWKMEGELEAGRAPGTRGQDAQIMVAGPVGFEVTEPVEFVFNMRFANDERAILLRVAPPPFAGGVMPPQPPAAD
jgi:Family of unknown function (DUF6941)